MPVDSDPNGLPLQKVFRDLVALSAVPSVWVWRESQTITADLAYLPATLLNLDFAFVRLYEYRRVDACGKCGAGDARERSGASRAEAIKR
jgi:hypothetical protein